MKKKMASIIMALLLSISTVPFGVYAEEIEVTEQQAEELTSTEAVTEEQIPKTVDTETEIAPAALNDAVAIAADSNLVQINEKNFPDPELREYLTEIKDNDKDGYIDANQVTSIDCCNTPGLGEDCITDWTGIELFIHLKYLCCGYNDIDALDLTHNTELETLYCRHNNLKTLDLSKCPKLRFLDCDGNELTSLDISKNPELISVKCSGNGLSSLDVSNNKKIQILYCMGNKLSSLNVDNNLELRELLCDENKLTSLNVSKNKNLTTLSCSNNNLSSLDISNNTDLRSLYIQVNDIKNIDVSKMDPDYASISLDYDLITSLDLSALSDVGLYLYIEQADVDAKTGTINLSKLKGYNFDLITDSGWNRDTKDLNFTWIQDSVLGTSYNGYSDFYQVKVSSGDMTICHQHPIYVVESDYVTVGYGTHVQSIGWQEMVYDGEMAGTSGQAKRLEGICINVFSNEDLGIQYTTHVQSYGWLPWASDGDMSGTEGEAKRLEAIKIQLTGSDKDKYDVYYRVHAQSYGWLGWAMNGAPAGTTGYGKRLEGIQILVVKKGENFDQNQGGITSARSEAYIALAGSSPVVGAAATSNANPVIGGAETPNVSYKTHVQSYGWQGWKYNGQMSGTSGQAKRLEGINIRLTNMPYYGSICYTTHVQSYGWQGDINNSDTWKRDGEMAGTSGQAKRLEAIMIKLTDDMADHYDVYYRVHAQSYGWLGWAKNGEPAGTAGYAKRLEGIQIVLVPKGGAAPSNSYGGINSAKGQAYIAK